MKNAFCRNGGSDETNKQKCGMKVSIIKLGCPVRMVVDSIPPHAKCGPNDHRKDAPLLRTSKKSQAHLDNEVNSSCKDSANQISTENGWSQTLFLKSSRNSNFQFESFLKAKNIFSKQGF